MDNVDNFSETVSLVFTLDIRLDINTVFITLCPLFSAKDNLFFIDCAKINYIFKHTLVLTKMREG